MRSHDLRRAHSDVNLSSARDPHLDPGEEGDPGGGGDRGGEFYVATGPDGKEIILRRYLNSQTPESDPYADRGFLNMAMSHLTQQQQRGRAGRRDIGVHGY